VIYVEETVVKKPMSGVEHLGGRKLVQPVNKEDEARRYRPGAIHTAGTSRWIRDRQGVAEQKAAPSEVVPSGERPGATACRLNQEIGLA
jgi:hypothetical protein